MIKQNKILGLLGISTKAGKLIFGTDSCMEAIKNKKTYIIIVATDASERTKKHFTEACKQYNIPIAICSNINELSKSIGKVNKAVIGIKDKNIANEILKYVFGGEQN